ncbi:MAG: hypothetical protein OEV44_12550 [Spirochaetota bacterium]|nr:hypothetical protein [Spirochaetota bacterium]
MIKRIFFIFIFIILTLYLINCWKDYKSEADVLLKGGNKSTIPGERASKTKDVSKSSDTLKSNKSNNAELNEAKQSNNKNKFDKDKLKRKKDLDEDDKEN